MIPNSIKSLLLLVSLPLLTECFMVPGFQAQKYKKGDNVPLYYNKIFSDKTQLPFAYSQLSFVCPPKQHFVEQILNFGELFQGDRIVESDFEVKALENVECRKLCTVPIDNTAVSTIISLIDEDYRVEWIMDGLPGATKVVSSVDKKYQYEPGFVLGDYVQKSGSKNGAFYLNNFFHIKIPYQRHKTDQILIVGFEVIPQNVKQDEEHCNDAATDDVAQPLTPDMGSVTYAYSVEWVEEPNVNWTARWDMYIDSSNPKIHW